jgi:hypothetical protein
VVLFAEGVVRQKTQANAEAGILIRLKNYQTDDQYTRNHTAQRTEIDTAQQN